MTQIMPSNRLSDFIFLLIGAILFRSGWRLSLFLLFGFSLPITGQTFEEVSGEAGLSHRFRPFNRISGGLVVFDFDNDGDDDVYVPGGRNGDALFQNDGTGHFTEVGEQYGIRDLTSGAVTISVCTGDINNDGYREIFIGTYVNVNNPNERVPNILLQYNQDSARYYNVAEQIGLTDSSYSASAVFFDANKDGWLDLYVTNYIQESGFLRDSNGMVIGFAHDCGPDHFYLNNGDGTFTDASSTWMRAGNEGCGLATVASDTDNDGDQDLLLINDFGQWIEPDALYRNDFPEPVFRSDTSTADFSTRHYGMGIAVGDVNEDLLMDYYITNIGANTFLINQGGNNFIDQAGPYRIKDEFTGFGKFTTGWGTFFADLNNDTYLDLYVANGFVNSGVDEDDFIQPDKVYRGLSDQRFFDASSTSGIVDTLTSRGAVYGDFNMDGLLDILVLTLAVEEAPINLRYYENRTENPGSYIGFRLSSPVDNRDAYGSRILVYAGGRTFLRELSGGGSHGSQHSSLMHFGLGDIPQVDSVFVQWPGGDSGWLYSPEINRIHLLEPDDLISSTVNVIRADQLTVYPNPSHGLLNIEGLSNNQLYTVFDLLGRQMAAGIAMTDKATIDLTGLAPGLYFLRIGGASISFVLY